MLRRPWLHGLRLLLIALVLASSDCGPTTLPPLGEVVVIVDTDAIVPNLVSRLRVDAFDEKGTWYASQDFGLESASQWPTSFGVFVGQANQGGTVTLRLRGYADGNVRDYLGERYQARPIGGPPSQIVPTPNPPAGDTPRLFDAQGNDVTPSTEPEPLLAIDRLLLIDVSPNEVLGASVVLHGACFGTMADLATSQTCVDTENVLVPVEPALLSSNTTPPTFSMQGSFGGTIPCTETPRGEHQAADGTPLYDEEVCVAGGTYVFGSYPSLTPQRIVTVEPFLMNKYEVSVGRFRDAVSRGLTWGSTPVANDSALPTRLSQTTFTSQADFTSCTYSDQPMGRETYPLSCVSWMDARAFCQFEGADLPDEVQFEWVVAAVARPFKTLYPWGGLPVDTIPCSRGIFGRGWADVETPGQCSSIGFGPAPVDQANHVGGDVSVGFGLVDLGYGVGELMLDSFHELDTRCWMEQPILASYCHDPESTVQVTRGGAWDSPSPDAAYLFRGTSPQDEVGVDLGLRCVRKGAP
jgi:formylglycine-generating enzyme required for sulfatase activity